MNTPPEPQRQVWQRSALDGTGYDLKARLATWQKRGYLSQMTAEIIMQGLRDGQAMDVYRDPRGKPVVEMNGETYTAREFDDLVTLGALAGGELEAERLN